MIEGVQLIADMPTGEQVKATIDSWNNLTAAAMDFAKTAAWIVPTAMGIVAQAAAVIKEVNSIPLLRFFAGNWGHAENAD